MWRELIAELDKELEIELSTPAIEDQVAEVEKSLTVLFPNHLRSLLLETDGIVNLYGLQIVWSIDLIKQNNLDIRQSKFAANTLSQFGNLLFFADAGNGDEYTFLVNDGIVEKSDIYVWRHEDDRLEWSIASLEEYLRILVST